MDAGIYNAKALQTYRGFKKGKSYVLDIKKPPNSSYEIFNVEEPNMFFTTASEISLKQKFELKQDIEV